MNTQPKAMTVTGWILTVFVGGMLIFSGVMKQLTPPEDAAKEIARLGWSSETLRYVGIAEICCAVLYLATPTSVLGAILLTGYLGGAIATHVRIHDGFFFPALGGVLVWLALYLRDPSVRALLPCRCRNS
jgi:uncharacterized membrane protein YphA (DoxX/SURF4 family)